MSDETKKQTQEVPAEMDQKQSEEMETKESFKPGQVFSPDDAPDVLVDESPEIDPELMKLYEKSFDRVHEGDIIKGTVVAVTDKDVIVDVGFKSEGMIPKEEFIDLDNIKVGDEIEVFLENPEDMEGQLLLSRRKVYFLRTWENLIDKHQKDEVIQGRIVRRIKGGFVVDLGGVDAFLPGSQVDVKPIRDFDAFVGQELDLKIVKVNEQRKNIVVSRRVIIEKNLESKRAQILGTLEKGQVRRGMVKNITDFGVFIDLGGVDGLLHITDLSWGRVNHPSEVVKLDEELDVMILDFDENKSRISLGLKQLQPHPWENVEERFPIGSTVKGRVVSLADYGAFVELEKGIEGLIHVSEMSWSQHIKNPAQVLKEGDEVKAVVLNIEPDDRKISLGLKQLTPDPWEEIEKKYPIDSTHRGVVRNLTPFGAFVELEEGVDGLVHISDLSWTKKVRHPSEVVKKGQEIDVVVLDINKEERRIALGHKQVESNPWDAFEDSYSVDTETKGTISRLIDKGVIVTLPLGVDAFVPLNHLGKSNMKRASDHFKVGDELPLKVIEFDKENKRIVLSVSEYLKGKEKDEIDSFMTSHNFSPTTMGDLVKGVPEVLQGLPDEEKGRERPARKPKTRKTAEEKEEEVTPEKAETEETAEEQKQPETSEKKSEDESAAKEEKVEETAEGKAEETEKKEVKKKTAKKTEKKEAEETADAGEKEEKPKEKKTSAKTSRKEEKAEEDEKTRESKTKSKTKKKSEK
ncbi:MAG: 30S ribosomal protein S1 [Calditrichaeota bacterium]|nr:30S ribosomal protein S1 [Calditrichota bacterium]RQV93017.1 MAG: 30S ribosomal protein S1 [bacterium]RQW08226.1 MAG: 30S ribosomal protein S1 [Calditrichota bacterium]